MTDEEIKAIETIKNFIKYYKKNEQTGNRANLDVLGEEIEAIQTALNLINKQEKAIDRMAEEIKDDKELIEGWESDLDNKNIKEIIEYFMEDKE